MRVFYLIVVTHRLIYLQNMQITFRLIVTFQTPNSSIDT